MGCCGQRMIMDAVAIGVALLAFVSVFTVMKLGSSIQSSLVGSASGCQFPAVFNFGDSNSDTGAASTMIRLVPPPNGQTFFGKPSGRYSDGRLIFDFIAEKLGLPYLSAYLDSMGTNFRHGANFAVGGATIKPEPSVNPIHLSLQLYQFEQFKSRAIELYNQGNKLYAMSLPRPEWFSKALYTTDIGQNDLHYGLLLLTEEQVKASIPGLIDHFALAIEKLYQEGARAFWIHNTGPIGCLPFFVISNPPKTGNADPNGCIKSYNEVAQEFNKQLKDRVTQLRNKFQDALLVYVDIYKAKYSLISEAKQHGFVNPLGFCCGHHKDSSLKCWDDAEVNGTKVYGASCSNPSEYISWDEIHYTEAANYWISNRIFDGSLSDPQLFQFEEFKECTIELYNQAISVPNPVFGTATCDFPAIFNFGDSNSDTGGLSAAFGQVGPPHGESYFHHPAGRYCDGRLVVDFIAESLGLPYLSAYLDSVGSNFTHGANFATAGSTVRPQNTTLQQSGYSPFSLNVQFYQFSDFHRRSQFFRNQGGVFKGLLPEGEDFSRALYTFDIGQNDLTAGYFLNMSTDQVRAYVPDVLDQFSVVVKSIYAQGGRSFWIHNTGPVGCLPYVMDRLPITAGQVDKAGCASPFNEVAQYFNKKLKEAVGRLRMDLPLAALTYVDVYSLKYSLISHAHHYGFVHPLQACCGHGGKYNYNPHIGCGGKITVHGKEVLVGKPCQDPSVAINWDGVHFTQAANKWVFDRIVDGSFSDPPIPLKMACHRHPPSTLK
ncbi:hypothetical protein RHGRI_034288 [Rhododendron griersonianum]|uniref:Alpha-L-fucosidase n=1 Tax=Rhododendron griersonianum TaxID=479676 RepID=A0AAV6I034_9ERIC|nr:hypothetical protein RHGRI_034288 [Rhododendron griersonianum]